MPLDPTDAPDTVRVPVTVLVGVRDMAAELGRTASAVEALRGEVAALRRAADAHREYLERLASAEHDAAAQAVALRRTADESSAATRATIKAWGWRGLNAVVLVGALFAQTCYDKIANRATTPETASSVESR